MSETNSHPITMSVRQNLIKLGVTHTSKVLLGVSGGVDSMVLLHVLKDLGYQVSAGHVNFNLRGPESLKDALFVGKWSNDHAIPFYELSKDTKAYASENKLGTQEAARDIRYAWWEELVHQHEFDFVATAHHLDDTIETMLLNLFRGTGFKGLTGIPRKRDFFIRPLLDNSKEEIASYAETFSIPYRMDQSNETDHYQRNKLRHHLVPLLREIYPGWHSSMKHTLQRLHTEWETWHGTFDNWVSNSVIREKDGFMIYGSEENLAFKLRWLEEKGIPWSLAYDFLTATTADTGTILKHQHLSLYRTDKGHYFEETPPSTHIRIEKAGKYLIGDFSFEIEQVTIEAYQIDQNPFVEFINETVVRWPLELRTINTGDRFQPLGMQGKTKKLQDYLVDLKLEMHEKQHQLLLASEDQIIWVLGRRLDERAKVKQADRFIYRISYSGVSGS